MYIEKNVWTFEDLEKATTELKAIVFNNIYARIDKHQNIYIYMLE